MKKKISSLLLLAFIFTLALPFTALAGSPGKALYLKNMQIQQNKQMQIDFDRPLSGVIDLEVSGDTLKTIDFQDIKANLKYDMDLKNDKAYFAVNAQVYGNEPLDFDIEFYIIDDTMIIPVESLDTLAQFDPQMTMPDENIKYLYTQLEGFSFAELQTILDQSSSQQEAAVELVQTIFEAIPDQCFSYNGDTAVMTVDKDSLVEIIKTFQDEEFIAELAEKLAALDPDLALDQDEIMQDMKTEQNDSDDVSLLTFLQNLTIRKCKTEIGPEKGLLDWDFGYSDEEMTINCKIDSKSEAKSTRISSATNMELSFESPADATKVSAELTADSSMSQDETSLNGTLNITGDVMGGMPLDLSAVFSIDQQYKDKVDFTAPVLTAENSMLIDELEPEIDDSGLLDEITVNINDEEFIWFNNAPFIESDHVLVPARELGEYLNCEIGWNSPATVTIATADKKINMDIGQKQYSVNGQSKTLDIAPVIKDDTAYVPVRTLAEELGYEVSYDSEINEVYLKN